MEGSRHLPSADDTADSAGSSRRQRESEEEADSLAKRLDAGVKLNAQQVQQEWQGACFPYFSRDAEGGIKGYHGLWRFYKPLGAHSACIEQQFHCIRTYAAIAPEGEAVPKMLMKNFHNGGRASATLKILGGSASFESVGMKRRSIDGLYVDAYARDMSDPYFSGQVMKLDPREEAHGLPPCCFQRSVPIRTINCAVRLAPALPPNPNPSATGGAQQPCSTERGSPARGFRSPEAWGFEVFIQDGDNRWSMGPLYDRSTRDFRSHFYIREYVTVCDPEAPIDLAQHPWKPARSMLDGEPHAWMDGGAWTGSMTDILWDEEGGEMLRLRSRPAVWTPPDPICRSHRLYRYDDLMYAYYPASSLPVVDADAEATFSNGIRFEVGGFMRAEHAFRRVILRYSVNGQVESLTEEVYRPPGDRTPESPSASGGQ